ncbi:MAG: dihydropteroate synthase-like protein [Archaeoglobaceae archaeon]|nr:dihydropteroate synthase-like protein [Archaeoglobaceae archaeon]MDW8013182.1 dihydropteroate synthase-like protein [Archaeoglobaceae archaeon]
MEVLLVTGKLAEKIVKKYSMGFEVCVVDVDVAAFITPKHLENLDLSKYDLVLVPGLTAENDWENFEKKKGTKIRLGPIHAYDLQHVLKFVGKVEFSHKIPACKLLGISIANEVKSKIDELEKDCKFKIREMSVGGKSRMKVVAEIAKFSLEEIEDKIQSYEDADVIDIGIPLDFDPDLVRKAIKLTLNLTDKPVSVDTFSKKAIEIAVKCGVDMIMSLSTENFDAIDLIDEQAVVIVSKNVFELKKLVEMAKRRTEKVIADPVCDPPMNFASSIVRYFEYKKLDPETPLLFGAGNITELCDADSIGMNALLAFIAEELDCSLIFTTEASPKTVGSVKELKIATYLAKASKIRDSPPKDLGFSLLVLKEKVRYPSSIENCVEAEESKEFVRDPCGDFTIHVSDKIYCKHEKLTICGKKSKAIVDTILREGLVSRLDHAAYLGRELMKAEIALRLKKNYVQDQDLNFGIY